MHYISTEAVSALILETIRRATTYARTNEDDFLRIIHEAHALKQGETAASNKKQLAQKEKRIAELKALYRRTFEDLAKGVLNENRFKELSDGYNAEQDELVQQVDEIKAAIAAFDNDVLRADEFLKLARKYMTFDELTPQILAEFVDKVIIHEADKISGKRTQQVDIYLNFIGQFDVPDNGGEPVDDGDEKRAAWREYKRKQREKKKQAQGA